MTKEEILAVLEAVDGELTTVRARFNMASVTSNRVAIKEEIYRQSSKVTTMVREQTGENGLAQELENVMAWIEHAGDTEFKMHGRYWVDKAVSTINGLLIKARHRGLDPVGSAVQAVEQPNPLQGELDRVKGELAQAQSKIAGLEGRVPAFPSKDEMSLGFMLKHFPWWLIAIIVTGLAAEFKLVYDFAFSERTKVSEPSIRPSAINPKEVHWER